MKKRNKIISIVLLSLLVIGLASASLLAYFGRITTTADVEQAVTLVGATEHTIPEAAPDGEEFCYLHKLDNKASVDIDVGFETLCSKVADGKGNSCTEIVSETKIYNISETRILNLCTKDPITWQCISGATATLEFDPVSPTFKGTLTTTGLSGNYALIYYPDKTDRFDPLKWNGEGGIVITTFTGDVTNLAIDENLNVNLPNPWVLDWNINPIPDYCSNHNGFDSYAHCKGAKIWIVKTSDLKDGNSLPLINWNPTVWLFETDLIVYSDCNYAPGNYAVDMEEGVMVDTTLTTESRAKTPMLVCYNFPVGTIPGIYTLTTDIVPQ